MIRSFLMLAICTLCAIVRANTDNWNKTALSENFQNRTYPIKSTGAFAEELDNHKEGKKALRNILVFLDTRAKISEQQVKTWRYGMRWAYPCTPVPRKIIQAVNSSLAQRGFGEVRKMCITNKELDLKDSIIRNLRKFYGALDEIKMKALEKLKPGLRLENFPGGVKWKTAYLFSTFQYKDSLQNCSILHLSAFRVPQGPKGKGIWALSADITNEETHKSMPDRKRQYLAENVFVDSKGHVRALNMTIENNTNVKTSLSVWGNVPGSSRFADAQDLRGNPAVDSAIRKHRRERMLAEDLITSYNVAILLLPLATALVPVASFADVPMKSMLVYLSVTDVAMMCPLFIMGVELISFSKLPQTSAYLRIYEALQAQDVGVAQLWYATCDVRNHLRRKGIIFLVVAILLMVLGISLELIARRRLRKSKVLFDLIDQRRSNIGSFITCDSYIPCSCPFPGQQQKLACSYNS